jgi:hypothetical protein
MFSLVRAALVNSAPAPEQFANIQFGQTRENSEVWLLRRTKNYGSAKNLGGVGKGLAVAMGELKQPKK